MTAASRGFVDHDSQVNTGGTVAKQSSIQFNACMNYSWVLRVQCVMTDTQLGELRGLHYEARAASE